MDTKTSNFQIAILVLFGFFTILGVILFSASKMKEEKVTESGISPIVVWGTVSSDLIDSLSATINEKEEDSLMITYVQKDPETIQQELIEALADGAGPDMLIASQDMILKNINKFVMLPYSSYPARDYIDDFIDVGLVYLRADGIMALPFIVDPMVMYWNKVHFVDSGIIKPPRDWDQFSKDVLKLTKKDSNYNIMRSGTALGEYQNIDHADGILNTLLLQAGVPLIERRIEEEPSEDGTVSYFYSSGFSGGNIASVGDVFSFYTKFANPKEDIYLWNKSLEPSLNSFISGDTSTYFGYASELESIAFKNPNLNFDVSIVPQNTNANKKSVYAKLYGLVVLKTSKNQSSAFNHAFKLTSKDVIDTLSSISNLPPIRKDVLEFDPADVYMKIFYDSALYANTFLNPDSVSTNMMYKNMVESIISGKATALEVVDTADQELNNIIERTLNIEKE